MTTLNPFVNTAAQDHDLRTLIYEPLLLQDKSYQVRSYLADSWEISKNGLVYTFSLRPDVTFRKGKALLADDVRWSIEYGQDPKNSAYGGDELRWDSSTLNPFQKTFPVDEYVRDVMNWQHGCHYGPEALEATHSDDANKDRRGA